MLKPVKWLTSVEKVSETEYNLVASASIDAGWHLYSQTVAKDGPIPTNLVFETNADYKLTGQVLEEIGNTVDDKIFNMKIIYFETKANFKQHIKLINKTLKEVVAEVEFMVCDDARCLSTTYGNLFFKLKKRMLKVFIIYKIQQSKNLNHDI